MARDVRLSLRCSCHPLPYRRRLSHRRLSLRCSCYPPLPYRRRLNHRRLSRHLPVRRRLSLTGLFSFPPQRSMKPRSSANDGVCVPKQSDLAWGVGVLMLTVLYGPSWTCDRFTAPSIRKRAAQGGVRRALDNICSELRAELAHREGTVDCVCVHAMRFCLEAWERPEEYENDALERLLSALSSRKRRLTIDAPSTPSNEI